ncbi:TPA: hypothetical protein R0E73_003830 [Aeromonas hydrophila subsp. hydrophila]|nr:hypothetical protein [Aeromonas hydrophila subsp. hydrophila]HEB5046863.1 hypothetical protein [Aeromonas hydrophila subsp. hydrophila]
MSLEAQIAALVQASNNLTGAVNNKIGEIDAHLEKSTAEINKQLEQTKFMLPRTAITKNQLLSIPSGQSLPASFSIHSAVTCTLYKTIPMGPGSRDPSVIALLQEIERDTGANMRVSEFYRNDFNIIKLSWNSNGGRDFLAFPHSVDSATTPSIPVNSYLTIGALVKVLSGSVEESWCAGAKLGKWAFCKAKYDPWGFGAYVHLHPYRTSQSGEVLIALPAAITGHIETLENWFPNINFQ